MTWRNGLALLAFGLVVGGVIGGSIGRELRRPAPVAETISAEAHAAEVDRWRAAQAKRRAVATVRRVTTTTTRPTGERVERVEETERREVEATDTAAAGEHAGQVETRSTVERRPEGTAARFRLSLGPVWNLDRPQLAPERVELQAELRTLGPVWVWARAEAPPAAVARPKEWTKTAGVKLALEW